MRLRTGDKVSVTGTVKYDQAKDDSYVHVNVNGFGSFSAPLENFTLVQHEIRVGDSVAWLAGANSYSGIVLAISGDDHAWVDRGGGMYATVLASCLQRTGEPEREESEEAA